MTELTKSKILAGISETETVEVDKLGGSVVLRPLTDAECSAVAAMAVKGTVITSSTADGGHGAATAIDVGTLTDSMAAAKRHAVSCSLSVKGGDKWNAVEVGKMPAGAPDEIYAHVVRITGLDPLVDADVEALAGAAQFRSD